MPDVIKKFTKYLKDFDILKVTRILSRSTITSRGNGATTPRKKVR